MTEFLADPPGWLQAVLWLCFLYVVFRVVVVSLLRTRVVRAYLTCRIHRVPAGFWDLCSYRVMGADPEALAQALATAPELRRESDVDILVRHGAQGGDVLAVATAWALSRNAPEPLELAALCAADLRGEDVLAGCRSAKDGEGKPQTLESEEEEPC